MSVQISHGIWSGSCGSFNDLRRKIAKSAGLDFDSNAEFEARNYLGWWDTPATDPLTVLLAHSDCDGYIFPFDAERLAERLEGLVSLLETDEDWSPIAEWSPRSQTLQLIEGLRKAADENEVVVFA